jgi:hypothetical protein
MEKINIFKNHGKPSVLSLKVFEIQKILKFSGLVKFPEMGKEF